MLNASESKRKNLPRRIGVGIVGGAAILALVGCADGYRRDVGGALGAIGGGVLGSKIGSGSGRLIATGVGAVFGGLIGADIGEGIDRAHAATRPPVVPGASGSLPSPHLVSSGPYARTAPQYGFRNQGYRTSSAARYDVSGCNQLSGGFRAAFACQDGLGRWFVVQ